MSPHSIKFWVGRGERPRRPSSALISDQIWDMLQACWDKDPTQRPTVEHIMTMCLAPTVPSVPAMSPPQIGFSNRSRDNPLPRSTKAQTSLREGRWGRPRAATVPRPRPYHPYFQLRATPELPLRGSENGESGQGLGHSQAASDV